MSEADDPRPYRDTFPAVPRHRAFVGMGGNLGDVQKCLAAALEGMAHLPGTTVEGVSSFYRTRPVDAAGPYYINAVAALQSALGSEELLRALQKLEIQHERERSYVNAPRTLDLDLLWYGGLHHQSASLSLPHPRMMQRAFVLVPLAELLQKPGGDEPALSASMPGPAERQALAVAQGIEKL